MERKEARNKQRNPVFREENGAEAEREAKSKAHTAQRQEAGDRDREKLPYSPVAPQIQFPGGGWPGFPSQEPCAEPISRRCTQPTRSA